MKAWQAAVRSRCSRFPRSAQGNGPLRITRSRVCCSRRRLLALGISKSVAHHLPAAINTRYQGVYPKGWAEGLSDRSYVSPLKAGPDSGSQRTRLGGQVLWRNIYRMVLPYPRVYKPAPLKTLVRCSRKVATSTTSANTRQTTAGCVIIGPNPDGSHPSGRAAP